MTKKFKGYLDRLRENVEVLDEAIATARQQSKPKGKADKAASLQWAKTLRDLVELRNTTLGNIKVHLLGRDETGAPNEPDDIWDNNSEIEYERHFRNQLSPWTLNDLKLKCEDCGRESEEVSAHVFSGESVNLCPACYEKRALLLECESCGVKTKDVTVRNSGAHWVAGIMIPGESYNLCDTCYKKRNTTKQKRARPGETEEAAEPASNRDIEALAQGAGRMVTAFNTLPVKERIAKFEALLAEKPQVARGMEAAYEAYVGVLQKALDDAKAEASG